MKNEEEQEKINRKRKNYHDYDYVIPTTRNSTNNFNFTGFEDQDDNDLQLTLSLPFRPTRTRLQQLQQPLPQPSPPPPPPPPPPSPLCDSLLSQPPPQPPLQLSSSHPLYMFNSPQPPAVQPVNVVANPQPVNVVVANPQPVNVVVAGHSRQRLRRNPTQAPREGKSDTVPPPFPWATTHRATVHSLNYLRSKQIYTISGEVQCKRCERQHELEYDLEQKFAEVSKFIRENKPTLHDRAPNVWMNPILPTCKFCEQENSAKPIIADSKKSINWLFLLLGQMLGCCTLEQLKYFCKHTKNHRTGAKDRVLYLTYLSLCKQLDPNGPYERI